MQFVLTPLLNPTKDKQVNAIFQYNLPTSPKTCFISPPLADGL
jgi:hypothetical protein